MRVSVMARLSLIALFACGCSASATSPTTSPDGGGAISPGADGGTGGGSGPISGVANDKYVTETRVVTQSDSDFSQSMVAALQSDGSGGFKSYPGTGTTMGFTIPNVPTGNYLLSLDGFFEYFPGAMRTLDLGGPILGRPDAASPTQTTNLVFNVTGMTAWTTNDELQLYSAGAGAAYYQMDMDAAAPLAAGATSLSNFTVDSKAQGNPLIDGSKGDIAYLTHLKGGQMLGDGITYESLTQAWQLPSFTQTDGQPSTETGAFSAPTTATLSFTFKRSAFHSDVTQSNASATNCSDSVDVYAQPGAASGLFSQSPDLIYSEPAAGTSDIAFTNVSFANPFPASWAVIGQLGTHCDVNFTAPGATSASPATVTIASTVPSAMLTGSVGPQLSAATALMLGGKAATTNLTGVGMTPTLSWSAPATGSATVVHVFIASLTNNGGQTAIAEAAQIDAPAGTTSVQIPPGVLKSGSSYFATVEVENITGSSDAIADAITGSFTP